MVTDILIRDCIVNGKKNSILIEDNKIIDIGKIKGDFDRVIAGEDKVALSGIVNTHTHLAMTLLRGIADDLPLMKWLTGYIWPLEREHLNPEFCYVGSLLGCLEMIKSGTTCFVDQYFFEDSTVRAVKESGLRAILAQAIIDGDTPEYDAGGGVEIAEKFVKRNLNDSLIKPAFGPHAPYTCGKETLLEVKELAKKYKVLIHIHISETKDEVRQIKGDTGMLPVEYLNKIGFLSSNVLAAHCVHLTGGEIKILRERGVGVSHNPVSNMKLGSGISPVPEMLNSKVSVSLGTDGCASNNNLDMFEEMKMAALLHKVNLLDPEVLSAHQVVQMVTKNAYNSLGLNCGLDAGKVADIILIDFRKPHLTPRYDIDSHLVYAANGGDVDTVVVNGKILMENREVKTLNEEEILDNAKAIGMDLQDKIYKINTR